MTLSESDKLAVKKIKAEILLTKVQMGVLILVFIGFVVAQTVLLSVGANNSHYLQRLVCASGIGQDCPPPDAKTIALTKQLAEQAKKRDDALLKKVQELLDRPAEVKTIVREGATRTIIITRTRTVTVCRLPNGRPC